MQSCKPITNFNNSNKQTLTFFKTILSFINPVQVSEHDSSPTRQMPRIQVLETLQEQIKRKFHDRFKDSFRIHLLSQCHISL